MRGPKEVKRGCHYVSVSNPSGYLLPLVHTASSKTCLVSDEIPPQEDKWIELLRHKSTEETEDSEYSLHPGRGNLFLAMVAAHFKMPHMEKRKREEGQALL